MKKITYSSNYIYYIINIICILSLLLITFSIEKSSNYIVCPIIERRQCNQINNVTINREILYGFILHDYFIERFDNDAFNENDENNVFNNTFGNDELVITRNDILNGYFG
ncbi:MAG TPA: hypothetical protein VFV86_03490 [Nitrososphaeraceae archaeon]|nr:hypothetical protein [Nitrososphaeraceae archaeon]